MQPEAFIVAQPSYAQWEKLPVAAKAARNLAEALKEHGYSLQHADLLDGGDKPKVEQALGDWLDTTSSDCIVLFWTGHGSSDGGHYLICRNSPRAGLTSFNAIDAQALGPVVANCKAEKILIILDTCYSGLGAGQIASAFAKVLANRAPIPGRERAIAVIASAHSLEKAQEGLFCNALCSALFEPAATRLWSDEDERIHTELLARAIKKALPGDVSQPDYKADGIGRDFVPNPRFRRGRPAENVEERAWRLLHGVGSEHFDLAARGIEVGEGGWFFAGRTRLLRKLVTWLEHAPHGARIVTGPPGAGKSAVMGRLATLSDPDYRNAALQAGMMSLAGDGTVPPQGIIDVAIHAKGKTLDDCARALAEAFSLPAGKEVAVDVDPLVTAIGRIDRRVTIMIDALDEAASGQGEVIAARLIVPLGQLEQVRVLIGSRRSLDGILVPQGEDRHGRLRAVFGPDVIIDDLEDEPETEQDVASYVRLRLAASPKHCDDSAAVAAVAERVAVRSEGSFLYARIVSRTLQDLDRLDDELPTTALGAFEQDLRARFGEQEQRVDDLLAALAWGEGKGLTRRVWPFIANALVGSERRYDDDDVAWALGHAGWHIIETGEDGQAVYRLGHQALADHYRGRIEVRDAQDRVVAALTDGIEGAGWLECDRYLWRHLADHAAQAGLLGRLIQEPGYLAVADPIRLVALLPGIEDDDSQRVADIYNRVADRLIEQPPLERLPLIHMTAQMETPDLAPQLEPPVATRWRCCWARVRRSAPHRIIGRHNGEVSSIALGAIDGRAVVVSGSQDSTIRLWDARTVEAIGRPLEGHTFGVNAVALGAIGDRMVVISGGNDRTVRLWDAHTGEPIGRPLEGHTRGISAVAVCSINNRAVVVSGSWDQTIRLWDLSKGSVTSTALKTPGLVTAVALGLVGDRALVISGSDDRIIRLWDAHTGEPVGTLEGHTGAVSAVAFGSFGGRAVVVSGSWDRTVRLWDALESKAIRSPIQGHTEIINGVAIREIGDRTILVSGSDDTTICLWDADTGQTIREPLRGHTGPVNSVALGAIDRHTVVISASDDQTIRLWDARRDEAIGEPFDGHTGTISAVAVGAINGRAIVVSGSDDQTIRLWDGYTGKTISKWLKGHTGTVSIVALGAIDEQAVVVSGSDDRTIRLSEAYTGKSIGSPLTGHTEAISTIAIGRVDGRTILVSGSDDRTIRLWHAYKGGVGRLWGKFRHKQVGKTLEGHTEKVSAVVLGAVDQRPVVVSGSHDRTIRLWDARTGETIGGPFRGHTEMVNAVALGAVEGRAVVVSGSGDRTIRLWDARTSEMIGAALEGHAGAVKAVAIGNVDGRTVVASGGDDGTVCLWDVSTHMGWFAVRVGMSVTYVDFISETGLVVGSNAGIIALDIRLVSKGTFRAQLG